MEDGYITINDIEGVFIRGDKALFYSAQLSRMLDQSTPGTELVDIIAISSLKGLVDMLGSCILHQDALADEDEHQLDLDIDGIGC